jgi:hypothetical protein
MAVPPAPGSLPFYFPQWGPGHGSDRGAGEDVYLLFEPTIELDFVTTWTALSALTPHPTFEIRYLRHSLDRGGVRLLGLVILVICIAVLNRAFNDPQMGCHVSHPSITLLHGVFRKLLPTLHLIKCSLSSLSKGFNLQRRGLCSSKVEQ